MGLLQRLIKAKNALLNKTTVIGRDDDLLEWLGVDPEGMTKGELSEATYFACMKRLSEGIGKLPIKHYVKTKNGRARADPKDKIDYLLAIRPNQFMTPTTFWTTVELNVQHYGNGYVWIQTSWDKKKKRTVHALWIMPSKDVTVLIDDKGIFGGKGQIWYDYVDRYSSEEYVFNHKDVMHFKTWYSTDGIVGISVRDALKMNVDGAMNNEKFLNNLYKNGLSASMALQFTSELDEGRQRKLIEKFKGLLAGPKNAGNIIPVPPGMQLQPLSYKLTDSQFLELKKYSASRIAAAFGVKPSQINDYDKSSYSSSEMQNLDFLIDTEAIRLKLYEEEMGYKLLGAERMLRGEYFKFNEKAALRTDSETQQKILCGYVNHGVYTVNEVREELDMEAKEGGDQLIVNGTYIPLKDVGTQYGTGGNEENEGDEE